MTKSYTEELAAWVEKRAEKRRRRDAAAVAFVAVKSDVMAAMEAGYALTTVWEHMQETGKVKCSYETFRKHVHRFIRRPAVQRSTASAALAPKDAASQQKPAAAKTGSPPSPGGFHFNPKPDRKDLY